MPIFSYLFPTFFRHQSSHHISRGGHFCRPTREGNRLRKHVRHIMSRGGRRFRPPRDRSEYITECHLIQRGPYTFMADPEVDAQRAPLSLSSDIFTSWQPLTGPNCVYVHSFFCRYQKTRPQPETQTTVQEN